MSDEDRFQAVCDECGDASDVYRFGTAIAWKVAHGLETGHVDVNVVAEDDVPLGSTLEDVSPQHSEMSI